MDGNVIFKKVPTARELRRNARRRETTKKRKEAVKAEGEPSSRPRCLGALRSPENSESTKRKKTAKSLATKKPRMDNPDNSVSSPSANVFSTALESDITQLDDRFDVSRQEKLAQSGEQLLKMIVDVTTIFNDIPSSCYPENENAKGASWAERMENMDSLWEGVRESVYDNFLSKQAYPLVIQCDNCSQSLSGGRAIRCLTCKKHYCGDCDFSFHAQQPFHNRWLVSSDSWYSLKTMEFVDSTGKLVEKDVPVPCFKPHQCTLCGSPAVHIESGSRVVIVVTSEGRFECKSSIFSCLECHAKVDATIHEYVQSNFMPGNPKALNFLYSVEVLRLWYLIKHNLPSSSEKKFWSA
ncbi:uncharacterized protein LOC123467994 [Daphnia magna]|uniref:uncharacterized protein LOC123467994 n=1 Tax=Daphnia magna TaxID=35525 RepID=UPI001E1BC890|nr:uncharacterized protein LOC123467994 [Daphnia magna]